MIRKKKKALEANIAFYEEIIERLENEVNNAYDRLSDFKTELAELEDQFGHQVLEDDEK